jgi:hypothetical protein
MYIRFFRFAHKGNFRFGIYEKIYQSYLGIIQFYDVDRIFKTYKDLFGM